MRHVYAETPKPERQYTNLKPSGSAWDTDLIACNGKYAALCYQVSGGGAFAVIPLSRPGKLPDVYPLARAHTSTVLDVAWSPFDDDLVASASEDCTVRLTRVDEAKLDAVWTDSYELEDLAPLPAHFSHQRKVGNLRWHPTAKNVLASASYEVKLWDVEASGPQVELAAHPDMVQSMSFNSTGALLATTCKDKKLRLFDVRAGPAPVKVADSHTGVKASRVCWMGALDRLVTTGFSRMSDRQIFVWDSTALDKPLKSINIDTSPGTLMPYWSDNSILFFAGKGDGNIRYYEWEQAESELYPLAEYKSPIPQRGVTFMPRRCLNVSEHEIMRGFKVTTGAIEPLSFVVPRKSDSFQADIHPPAPSAEPAMSAGEFFGGKTSESRYVSLESRQSVAAPAKPASSASAAAPASAPSTPARQASAPSPTTSAPSPAPAASPARQQTAPVPSSPARSVQPSTSIAAATTRNAASDDESAFPSPKPSSSSTPSAAVNGSARSGGGDSSALQAQVDELKDELAERDTRIRTLELELEKLRSWRDAVRGAVSG